MLTLGIEETDEEDVKKRRNPSKIKVQLSKLASEQGVKPILTTMSVKLGLQIALKLHPKKLRRKLGQYFEDRSRSLGCWRWFISLYAAYRYASVCSSLDNSSMSLPKLCKTFFDKCWSAADHIRMGWEISATDEVEPMKKFIRETNFPIHDLPDRMQGEYELRSPIARDMSDITNTYIHKRFPKWVYEVCRFELVCLLPDLPKKIITQVAHRLYQCILGDSNVLDANICRLRKIATDVGLSPDKTECVVAIQQDHRGLLSSLYEFEYKKKGGEKIMGWAVATKVKPHLALPYLAGLSRTYEQFWNGLDDNGRYQAKCNRIPKPFPLIPVWKCEPVFVDFASTQMQVLYNKFGADESWKGRHGRPRPCRGVDKPKIDPLNLDQGDLQLFDLSTVAQLRRRNVDKHKIKWHVTGLSTNGVELVVKLSAFKESLLQRPLHTTNREHLFKAGYNIPKPSSKVSVETQRGIYKLSETRSDIRPLTKQNHEAGVANQIEVICIDPGCSDVISVRQSILGNGSNPSDIIQNSSTWSVSNKMYQTMIGSGQQVSLECGRRNLNVRYGDAIHNLENTRRRSTVPSSIQTYIEKMRPFLKTYMKEVTSRYRRYIKWQIERRRTGVIDCLANMIFGKVSSNTEDRLLRHVDKYQLNESWTPHDKMGEKVAKRKRHDSHRLVKCRERLHEIIKQTRERRRPIKHRVCFFGDGTFGAQRGNASVPRKDLVRALARRGLTFMLDEFRTSARCPGCGSEMKDDDKGHRIRQCTSIDDQSNEQNNDACPLYSKKGGVYKADRDEVATVNMVLCAVSALEYGRSKCDRRPAHLCRNTTITYDNLDSLIHDTGNVSC